MVVGTHDGLGTCKPKSTAEVWRQLQKQVNRRKRGEPMCLTFCQVEIPPIRVVLTKGIAGIGKTFSVYKFIHDVAEKTANEHINYMIPFSFRELNYYRKKQFSFLSLIHKFHPSLRWVDEDDLTKRGVTTMIVFDGLDQSQIPMDFDNHDYINDLTVETSLSVLLTNLITANMYPQAQLWITTRPEAAKQIPREYVDRVTEVRGFVGPQIDEYFLKRFSDKELARRFIAHMHATKRLCSMCHVPLFCSIVASIVEADDTGHMPDTLTDVLFHFLMLQDKKKKEKDVLEQKHDKLVEAGAESDHPEVQATVKELQALDRMQETDIGLAGVTTRRGAYWHLVLPTIHDRAKAQTRIFIQIR